MVLKRTDEGQKGSFQWSKIEKLKTRKFTIIDNYISTQKIKFKYQDNSWPRNYLNLEENFTLLPVKQENCFDEKLLHDFAFQV